MFFRRGLKPDRMTRREQTLVCACLGYQTAAGFNYRSWVGLDHLFQALPFQPAESGLAKEVKNFVLTHAGGFFDLLVQLHEGQIQAFGQSPAQGALARAAQADQGDAVAVLGLRRVALP